MRTFNEVKTQRREKPLKPSEQGLLWRAALRERSLHKAKGGCASGSRDPERVLGGLVLAELALQRRLFAES